jgi:hypothetical protein
VCLWICLLDDDLVEVETCRRNISDKLLLSPDCAIDLLDQLLNITSQCFQKPTLSTPISISIIRLTKLFVHVYPFYALGSTRRMGKCSMRRWNNRYWNTAIITGSFSHWMKLHCQTANTRKRGFAEMMKERGKDGQYNNTNNSGLYRVTTQSKHLKGLLDLTCNFIFLQTSAEIIL